MKKIPVLIVILFLVSAFCMSCMGKGKKSMNPKELISKNCNKCHFSDKIYKRKYTREDWNMIVNRMVMLSKDSPNQKDLEISHEDAYDILLFLQKD